MNQLMQGTRKLLNKFIIGSQKFIIINLCLSVSLTVSLSLSLTVSQLRRLLKSKLRFYFLHLLNFWMIGSSLNAS